MPWPAACIPFRTALPSLGLFLVILRLTFTCSLVPLLLLLTQWLAAIPVPDFWLHSLHSKSQFFFLANKVYFCSTFHKGYCLLIYFPKKIQLFLFLLHSGSQGPLIKGERRERQRKRRRRRRKKKCIVLNTSHSSFLMRCNLISCWLSKGCYT